MRIRLALAFLLLASIAQANSSGTGATLPATCTVGDCFKLTAPPHGEYHCSATNTWTRKGWTSGAGGDGAAYGSLTGTLSDQTDLQAALDAKAGMTHTHGAADIASGTIAPARLGGGTANSSTFLRGDQTWATPAGGGGSSNFAEVTLTISDTVVGLVYSTTVTGQAWVTSTSKIVCSPLAVANGSTPPELSLAAGFTTQVTNRVNGVGFDLSIYNPHGASGTFTFECAGS